MTKNAWSNGIEQNHIHSSSFCTPKTYFAECYKDNVNCLWYCSKWRHETCSLWSKLGVFQPLQSVEETVENWQCWYWEFVQSRIKLPCFGRKYICWSDLKSLWKRMWYGFSIKWFLFSWRGYWKTISFRNSLQHIKGNRFRKPAFCNPEVQQMIPLLVALYAVKFMVALRQYIGSENRSHL